MNKGICTLFLVGIVALPHFALAHRSGCHNLHTCPSDNNAYVCGDLGYPCDGSTSAKKIAPTAIAVPLVIEKAFGDTFGRRPTEAESKYWKSRFRNDKDGLLKLRRTLAWHKTQGSFGPKVSKSVATSRLVHIMNDIFLSVYGRLPTMAENQYWLSRIADKPTEEAIKGAMVYHKVQNMQH